MNLSSAETVPECSHIKTIATDQQSDQLRNLLITSLRLQGFQVQDGRIIIPQNLTKEDIRRLHLSAVQYQISLARKRLQPHENRLIQRIASGHEVDPSKVSPRLIEVIPCSEDEMLFRYASLHWSIPTSSGYGRRLRFLVEDEHNNKLIGLIGLCDPVFSIAARDTWIGWNYNAKVNRLRNVMEAFIIGAVPPYSMLLCGKLIAMICASNEIRQAFQRKYGTGRSVIRRAESDGRLALITTFSALGRSSIYNRLKYRDRLLMLPVGYTSGHGSFHITNELYPQILAYAKQHFSITEKSRSWGKGFRNKRQVIRIVLKHLGLPRNLEKHGIARQVFVMPLASNTREFLRGEHQDLAWFDMPLKDLADYFRERWLIPRANRNPEFARYSNESFRLWKPHQPTIF